MQSKILLKKSLPIVSIVGATLTLAIVFTTRHNRSQIQDNLIDDRSVGFVRGITAPEPASVGLPTRLRIPVINVDAAVEPVGLTSDGAMDIPKNQNNVAWYEPGTHPGENGSAVIAGHYGWIKGKPSVFDKLYKIRAGDKIYLEDDNGTTISFVVRESRRYDAKTDASDVFNTNGDISHLNLITCEGTWNEITKSYPSRLVVFTDKE